MHGHMNIKFASKMSWPLQLDLQPRGIFKLFIKYCRIFRLRTSASFLIFLPWDKTEQLNTGRKFVYSVETRIVTSFTDLISA